jgi:hypothetical protein
MLGSRLGFRLRWVGERTSISEGFLFGYHVYCVDRSGLIKIDVCGTEDEHCYIKRLNLQDRRFSYEPFDVDLGTLFSFSHEQSFDGYKRTAECLRIDVDLVSAGFARAVQLILSDDEKFLSPLRSI